LSFKWLIFCRLFKFMCNGYCTITPVTHCKLPQCYSHLGYFPWLLSHLGHFHWPLSRWLSPFPSPLWLFPLTTLSPWAFPLTSLTLVSSLPPFLPLPTIISLDYSLTLVISPINSLTLVISPNYSFTLAMWKVIQAVMWWRLSAIEVGRFCLRPGGISWRTVWHFCSTYNHNHMLGRTVPELVYDYIFNWH